MLFNFRTVLVIVTLVSVTLIDVSQSSLIRKTKLLRVVRASVPERTRLPDGTRFEEYSENGKELPPLPIGEEEADDLNDPRIGHLDKDGGIAVPVDDKGNVLPGFEYLLKPITITIDLDEKDDDGNPDIRIDSSNTAGSDPNSQQNYDPYPGLNQNQLKPSSDLRQDEETAGEEYDDVPSEPREPLPQVPDLPKPDYTDSGESDEEMKVLDEEDEDETKDLEDAGSTDGKEVIVPSSRIEQPALTDNVEEKSQSVEDIEEKVPEDQGGNTDEGRSIDIPKNRMDEDSEERRAQEEESIGLTEEDVEELAQDFGKSVFENVMNKAYEFSNGGDETSGDGQDLPVDPNSIVAEPQFPSIPELPIEKDDTSDGNLDGVVLPDQSLSDDEVAKIVEDSLNPEPTAAPSPPIVRGGRIGAQPDSASQYNILLSFFLVFLLL